MYAYWILALRMVEEMAEEGKPSARAPMVVALILMHGRPLPVNLSHVYTCQTFTEYISHACENINLVSIRNFVLLSSQMSHLTELDE